MLYQGIFLRGLGLGASLIIAIGAQNSFVLRMGLRRRFVFTVALLCALCDVLLISLGAAGFGSIVSAFPLFTKVAAWGGAIFLFYYGLRSFRSALKPSTLDAADEKSADTSPPVPLAAPQYEPVTLKILHQSSS